MRLPSITRLSGTRSVQGQIVLRIAPSPVLGMGATSGHGRGTLRFAHRWRPACDAGSTCAVAARHYL